MLAGLYMDDNNTPKQNIMHIPSIPAPKVDMGDIEPSLDQLKQIIPFLSCELSPCLQKSLLLILLKLEIYDYIEYIYLFYILIIYNLKHFSHFQQHFPYSKYLFQFLYELLLDINYYNSFYYLA